MKRAILTGFEPFGPYKFNPTQDIAEEFNGRIIRDIEVIGLVLPSTYYSSFRILADKIRQLSPDIVLNAGLASKVNKIRIEAIGRNIMNHEYPDGDGEVHQGEPIIPGGAHHYMANSNAVSLADSLYAAGLPAEASANAEGYICNSLLYQVSGFVHENRLKIKNAFFHTPWTDDYIKKVKLEPWKTTIKKEDLIKTVEVLIQSLARRA